MRLTAYPLDCAAGCANAKFIRPCGEFFYRLFKRMRKYNAFITAISQNVDEILRSDTARLMLANSELLVMLN